MKLIEIQALNFMRFHKIQLLKIPERGLFCIQGENESGKSTIGSLLFFAFSGIGPKGEEAEELISWEKSQLKVKVSFEKDNQTYHVMRQVDRDGTNFSRLVCEDKTIARGNTPIVESLNKILQYHPKELDRSFLVTHRVIQNLASLPREEHLEYMLHLSPLKNIAEQSKSAEEELIKLLEEHQKHQSKLEQSKVDSGFDSEKQALFIQKQEDQTKQKGEFEQQLQTLQSQQTGLQSIQDQLNEGTKLIPSKFSEEATDELEQTIPSLIEKFSQIHVVDKTKECLSQSTELLTELQHYFKQSKALRSSYESYLSDLRHQLGLANEKEPDAKSLIGKSKKAFTTFKSSLKALKVWTVTSVIAILVYVSLIASLILRPIIVKSIKDTKIYEVLNNETFLPLTTFLRECLKPSSLGGIPLDPRFLIFIGAFTLIVTTAILLVLFYRKKSKQLKVLHETAQKEQDLLQHNYNNLLSADFRDMSEVGTIIESSDNDELIKQYHDFKEEHEHIIAENFQIEPVVRLAKDHLEEAHQNLSLDMHKLHNQLEEKEKELNTLLEELKTSEDNVKDMQNKQELYESITEEITNLDLKVKKDKDDCSIQKGLAELSHGTISSVRQRFQRDLTGLFKTLMPLLTEERYGAVRVSDSYDLEVFSDERGDFVKLRSLSSGTNDLFNLIFQVILLKAFMESRDLKDHFLFLDEPLLAVDVQRYQRLFDLLPDLSKGLGQIFLCRPPQSLEGAILLETSLDSKDLIVDFSKLVIHTP